MSNPTQGSATSSSGFSSGDKRPDHLLVLVHGILASPKDWIYAEAELKRRLGANFLIYVSSANSFIKTFEGIDVAGRRLAAEVENVVEENYGLTKISFLAHSLGGMFTRYAIAVMYSSDDLTMGINVTSQNTKTDDSKEVTSSSGLIAGLEPINFITLATPHLGVRGNKQLPFLLGLEMLEKLAAPLAPLLVGQTGRQLFLTDGKPSKRPLLLRMASDILLLLLLRIGQNLNCLNHLLAPVFLSLIPDMVGWRTSSIRRETELKPSTQCLDGYKHIVGVEHRPAVSSDGPQFPSEAAMAKKAAQEAPTPQNTDQYHHIMEEEMIRGLQRVSWKKVDVSFHATPWPFFAHNNIHVKTEWLHNAGASIISHVADSIKQHEYRTCIIANL
ncbi:lipase [Carex littledalei]|uniref:Lipase n=1 Tax=Carex littledalei TaxID=544730 RepID=A0A833RHV2_9POAL|nr:lipase [Carex littledalei]